MPANVSIGSIGKPYYDSTNDRTKAFIPTIVETQAQARDLLQDIMKTMQGNRMTVRILCGQNIDSASLSGIEGKIGNWDCCLEGFVPVRNGKAKAIAYFGANQPERQPSPDTIAAEKCLLDEICRSHTKHPHSLPVGFSLEAKSPDEPGNFNCNDIDRLIEIYSSSFTGYLASFDRDNINAMLIGNYVAIVRDSKRRIAAIAMAERAKISYDANSFTIAEISEVATHPEFHKRGFGHITFGALVERLHSDNIDLVFSEVRANHYGIIAIALDSGMIPRGHLPAHCVISSRFSEVEQESRYGNLFIMA